MALGLASYSSTSYKIATSGTTLASNSFSPAAGDIVYVVGWIDNSGGSTITESTPTDTSGKTWNFITRNNTRSGSSLNGTLFVYWASFATAPGSVTVTISGGSSGAAKAVAIVGFTGAASSQSTAANGNFGASGTPSVALTTTAIGSWCWGAMLDFTTFTSSWVAGSGLSFQIGNTNDGAGDTINMVKENPQPASTRASGTNVTITETGVTGDSEHLIAWEVLPSSSTQHNVSLAATTAAEVTFLRGIHRITNSTVGMFTSLTRAVTRVAAGNLIMIPKVARQLTRSFTEFIVTAAVLGTSKFKAVILTAVTVVTGTANRAVGRITQGKTAVVTVLTRNIKVSSIGVSVLSAGSNGLKRLLKIFLPSRVWKQFF